MDLDRRRRTRNYFVANAIVGAAIVNALINGTFGWLAMLKLPALSVWGTPGVAIDTILTAFGVAFGTALVVPIQARSDLFAGKVSPDDPSGQLGKLIDALPPAALPRALLLGAACVLLFVPVPLLGLGMLGLESMQAGPFVTFKIAFSVVVSAAVTPLVMLHAVVVARGRAWPGDLTR